MTLSLRFQSTALSRQPKCTKGKFPIWAYQHSYTKGEPEGLAKEFLDYLMNDDIQKSIVTEQGYIPVTDMEVKRDANGKQTDK